MSENLKQYGKIIETRAGMAKVLLYRPTACSGCHGCSAGEGRNEMLSVRNPLSAAVGQSVRIELAPRSVLQAALIVYALPLVLMACGYVLGLGLARMLLLPWAPDTIGGAVGLIALLLSFILIRKIDRQAKNSGRFEPFISAVVTAATAQEQNACQVSGGQQR